MHLLPRTVKPLGVAPAEPGAYHFLVIELLKILKFWCGTEFASKSPAEQEALLKEDEYDWDADEAEDEPVADLTRWIGRNVGTDVNPPLPRGTGGMLVAGARAKMHPGAERYLRENPHLMILPMPGSVGGGAKIAPAVLKWAQKLGLNVNSATTQHILRCLDMPVTEYIAKFRKGSILRQFPGEFLREGVTLKEALKQSSKARKLLQHERFAK